MGNVDSESKCELEKQKHDILKLRRHVDLLTNAVVANLNQINRTLLELEEPYKQQK